MSEGSEPRKRLGMLLEPTEPSPPGIFLYLAVVFNFDFAIRGSSIYLISSPALKV